MLPAASWPARLQVVQRVVFVFTFHSNLNTIFVVLNESAELIKSAVMYLFGSHLALMRLPKLDGPSLAHALLHLSAHVKWLHQTLIASARGMEARRRGRRIPFPLVYSSPANPISPAMTLAQFTATTFQQASIDRNQDRLSAWFFVSLVPRSQPEPPDHGRTVPQCFGCRA